MAEREVKIPVKAEDQTAGVFRSVASKLKDLNREAKELGLAGKSSIVGLLKGAGAFAGIGLLAHAFSAAAVAAKDWAAGTISGGEALLHAAEGIPIVGAIATAAAAAAQAFGLWSD